MEVKHYDFGGYATKNDLKCSDGRTIRKDAFKHNNGKRVPLVWQHLHDDPSNVLGHADLENREDGVYAKCSFNNSAKANEAKEAVKHGDLMSLSIFANQLKQMGGDVLHGDIKEVSLVLSGANPGAKIDNLVMVHSDETYEESEYDAIITLGEENATIELSHADEESSSEGKTLGDIFDTLTDEQKEFVYAMVGAALGGTESDEAAQSDLDEGDEDMKKNVFDTSEQTTGGTLSHSEFSAIMSDAQTVGSLKQAFLAHAAETNGTPGVDYGINGIELLFPEYRNVRDTPDFIKRDDAWVAGVINGTNKTPFARIRTMTVDVTEDAARAKGYKKGHLKKEEVIKMAKRTTNPTTVYKKQKLDRDDIIDITDMDVVAFLKSEMQMMLREEIARQILVGDGRDAMSEDKIDDECIRPILKEDELYASIEEIDMSGETDNDKYGDFVDQVVLAMIDYRGSGAPTFFTTKRTHTKLKLVRDKMGRKLYESDSALADAMGVSAIVDVPVMEGVKDSSGNDVLGIIVNLRDYTIGTNRGGQTTFFDDFDIDFNQYKYLYETRMSGALTRPDSAIILVASKSSVLRTSASRPVTTE